MRSFSLEFWQMDEGLHVLPTQPSPQFFCKPLLAGVNCEPEENWPECKLGGTTHLTHFLGRDALARDGSEEGRCGRKII